MDVNHRQIARSVANQNGFPGHMGAPLTLIHELESSISNSSDERRSAMLRHLTDLFLVGSDQYSDAEIDLIDDVFVRLVATIEDFIAGAAGDPARAGIKRTSRNPASARLR